MRREGGMKYAGLEADVVLEDVELACRLEHALEHALVRPDERLAWRQRELDLSEEMRDGE